MKKRIIFGILAVWMAACLSGCCMSHEWKEATCTEPQTCAKCGKTQGKELGHEWTESDCTHPQACSVCGETKGEAAGHKWQSATCTEPQICSVCGETVGRPAGHKWHAATCTAPKTCSACGSTEGALAEHKWKGASCTQPKICSTCGATEGEALGHSWEEADCLKAKTCTRCQATEGEALGHELNDFHACIRCKEYFGTGTYLNFSDVKVNGSLYLGSHGRYEPSAALYQRESKPIEWIVLDKQEDKLLVLSKYFLQKSSYGTMEGIQWDTSQMRKYLNNNFLYPAFTAAERNAILDTEINDPDCGEPVTDKIFLLSKDEYLTYCIENGAVGSVREYRGTSDWWLRSKEETGICVARYTGYKNLEKDVVHINDDHEKYSAYVRPAMWIPIEMELLEEQSEDAARIPQIDLGSLQYGDKFSFGAYEMNGDYTDGSEPLEWYVTGVGEDYVNAISVYAFCALDRIEWSTYADHALASKLLEEREDWLENVFYQKAFSDAEKDMFKVNGNHVWMLSKAAYTSVFNNSKIPVKAVTWQGASVQWALKGQFGAVGIDGRIWDDGHTVYGYVRPCISLKKEKDSQGAAQVKCGDLIEMGSYEQDNDLTNGKEPISWRVLNVHGDEALVVSDKALDHQPYDTAEADKRYFWSKCSLRDWLNKEFYEEAFTEEERARIVSTETSGILIRPGSGLAQEETYDYIFCLYKDEIVGNAYAATEPTPYAESRGAVKAVGENCGYWLRGSGDWGAPVMQPGGEKAVTAAVDNMFAGVRPAMWIKLQ